MASPDGLLEERFLVRPVRPGLVATKFADMLKAGPSPSPRAFFHEALEYLGCELGIRQRPVPVGRRGDPEVIPDRVQPVRMEVRVEDAR
jgi:hypothetical protein